MLGRRGRRQQGKGGCGNLRSHRARPQAGSLNDSPRLSTAQAMRAFLAAMAPSSSRVVLASLARHPVRRDQLGRHQPHRVPVLLKLSRPVVHARARLHPDHGGRQCRNQRLELGPSDLGLAQLHHTPTINTVHRKNILRKIDTCRNNGHGTSPSK